MTPPVQIITEKSDLNEAEYIEMVLNARFFNMGPRVGIVAVDRDHSNFKFYIKAAIQIANFFGDDDTKKELQSELDQINNKNDT